MPNVKINLIRIERRIRKQLSNIESLAESIRQVGLINPITIDSNYRLVAGERRLKAAQDLGWTEIPTTIAANLTDALDAIKAERDENTQREPLTAGEIHEAARLLEEIEKEAAKKRQAHGQTAPGRNASGKLPEAISKGDTRDKVAEAFDISGKTLDNIHKVFDGDSEELKEAVDSGKASVSAAAEMAGAPKDDFREELEQKIKSGEMSIEMAAKAIRIKKTEERKQQNEVLKEVARQIEVPPNRYQTIVIDPPWDIKKIVRDVRPGQVEDLDYPVMSFEEIKALPVADWAHDAAHIYLWTTQRFLPKSFELLEVWGFSYVFSMVWHKPGGFQPLGLPQYNCEFIIFGKKGSLPFDDTKNFFTCFDAPRREHSRKPDFFYDLVRRVSPGPRIDVFSREIREGFDQYGNESSKFAGEVVYG